MYILVANILIPKAAMTIPKSNKIRGRYFSKKVEILLINIGNKMTLNMKKRADKVI